MNLFSFKVSNKFLLVLISNNLLAAIDQHAASKKHVTPLVVTILYPGERIHFELLQQWIAEEEEEQQQRRQNINNINYQSQREQRYLNMKCHCEIVNRKSCLMTLVKGIQTKPINLVNNEIQLDSSQRRICQSKEQWVSLLCFSNDILFQFFITV